MTEDMTLVRFDLLPAYVVFNPLLTGDITYGEPVKSFVPLSLKERFMWWLGRKLIEFGNA